MPTSDRTRAELLEWARKFRRAEHERKVRAGRAKPRNCREVDMFAVDLLGPREEPDAPDKT